MADGVWHPLLPVLPLSALPHCATKGVNLDLRSKVEMSTSFFEWQLYMSFLRQNLDGVSRELPLLELGAGDGRITSYLLKMGFRQIVACDCNIEALQRIHSKLEPGERQRVVLVGDDMSRLRLPRDFFGAIVAIEVLYYLNENYENMLAALHTNLGDNGLLLNAEPLLEGALIYALVAQDWDNVNSLCHDRLKIEHLGQEQAVRSRVFTLPELTAASKSAGFEIKDLRFTSALNSLAVRQIGAGDLGEKRKLDLLRSVRSVIDKNYTPRCALLAATKLDRG